MMADDLESDILQRLAADLQAEGYEVFTQPGRSLVPRFLGNYIPDAIARRESKSIAIELTRRSPGSERKVSELVKLFEGQKDWEFRVIWVEPATSGGKLQVQSRTAIAERVAEIRQLISTSHFSSALLLAWASFEAVGRLLAPDQFQRPQTPGRLVQVLASEGYLTPTEADKLRALASKRNTIIHGELQTSVSREEVEEFAGILDTLSQLAAA